MEENLKQIYLEAVEGSQHCQRNWDYTKEVSVRDVEWLWKVGTTTPTKENVNTFEINVIKDRKLINQISNFTKDPSYVNEECYAKDRLQNPQTSANIVFLFWVKHEVTVNEFRDDKGRLNVYEWYNVVLNEIGISASAIAVAANLIGLKTGFCRCMDKTLISKEFKLALDRHPDDDLMLALGVGYPLLDRPHNYHNNAKYQNLTFSKVKKSFKIY